MTEPTPPEERSASSVALDAEPAPPLAPPAVESGGEAEQSDAPDRPPLHVQLQAMRDELGALRGAFEAKILKDRGQQQIIDRLHASLKEAEADLVWNIRRPILIELVQLYDDLAAETGKPGAPDAFGRYLQDVTDLLYRLGVEPYHADGEQFDARTQVARRKTPAPTAEVVGTVAERLRPGFRSGRHTLRPESVAVYVRDAAQPQPSAGDHS